MYINMCFETNINYITFFRSNINNSIYMQNLMQFEAVNLYIQIIYEISRREEYKECFSGKSRGKRLKIRGMS